MSSLVRLLCYASAFCVCPLSIAEIFSEELPPGWLEQPAASASSYCAGGFIVPKPAATETGALDIRARQILRGNSSSSFQGDVLILDGETTLRTDYAIYRPQDKHLELPAGFELADYSLLAAGQRLDYYIEDGDVLAQELRFSLPALHAWGEAGTLLAQRDGNNKGLRISLQDGRISFCDPTEDSWHLEASRIDLDQASRQGRARGLKIFINESPVIALPYLQFPLGNVRQSGLLYPSVNLNSRSGLVYSQPFYVNIAPNLDTTLYGHILSRRGFLLEHELRWLTQAGSGLIGYGYLPKDALIDKERSAQHLSFDSVVDRGWSGSVLVNSISDSDYLRDLPYFFNVEDDLSLPSAAQVRYDSKNIQWSLGALDYQSLQQSGLNRTQILPYRQLPYTHFSYAKNLGYGFSWFQNSEYVLFSRQEGDHAEDSARLFNELALRWAYERQGGRLRAALRLEDIRFNLADADKEFFPEEVSRSSVYLDGKLVFSSPSPVCDCYVTLEPRLYALYANRQQQQSARMRQQALTFDTVAREPDYDALFNHRHYIGDDRLASEQRLVMGLESRLINLAGSEEYRLRLARAAYLTDRELAPGEEGAGASFSPWVFDVAWYAPSGGYLEAGIVQENQATLNRHLTGHLTDLHSFDASLSYYGRKETFYQQQAEQLSLALVAQANKKWSLFGASRYDVEESNWQSFLVGFAYENCCIRVVNGLYEEQLAQQREKGLVLRFVFKPWGDIGSSHGLKIEAEEIYNSVIYGIHR